MIDRQCIAMVRNIVGRSSKHVDEREGLQFELGDVLWGLRIGHLHQIDVAGINREYRTKGIGGDRCR